MLTITGSARGLAIVAVITAMAAAGYADDELRNVKKGESVPTYRLPALDGTEVSSQELLGSPVVIVCLSAQQRRSELAAIESYNVVQAMEEETVRLVHMTANAAQKDYFATFREEHGIDTPLLFDVDRDFYGKLPLIVLPTTIVVDAEGKLAHVISLHSDQYENTLKAYILHTLGKLADEELQARLQDPGSGDESPHTRASAHRALARSMREKGQLVAARKELLDARKQQPDDPEIILDLADLDLLLGELARANELVDLVLEKQPNHRRAQQLKGIVHFHRGELDKAEQILSDALKLNPAPERIHFYLGQICERNGDTKGALEHYRKALQRLLDEPESR